MTDKPESAVASDGWKLVALGRAEEAVEWFDAYLAKNNEPALAARLLAGHAEATLKLRRFREALRSLDQLVRLQPENAGMRVWSAAISMLLAQHEEALATLDSPVTRTHAKAANIRIECLISLWRIPEARDVFDQALKDAREPSELGTVLATAGRLYGRGDGYAGAMRRAFDRLSAIGKIVPPELACRVLAGIGDLDGLRSLLSKPSARELPAAWLPCAHAALGNLPPGRRIFGIGLSRTGTTSLNDALAKLGIASFHWSNPLTTLMLDRQDVPLFKAQTDGWPSADYEAIARDHPDALFILTDRETSSWSASYRKHVKRRYLVDSIEQLKSRVQDPNTPCPYGEPWRELQQRLYVPYDSFAQAFEDHRRKVLAFFADKPGRLLHLPVESKEPWSLLCNFLGKPVPQAPYPHRNPGT